MTAEILTMTDAEYFADTTAITRSMILDFRRSRSYYHARHVTKTIESPDTPAMRFGRFFHCLVLTPGLVDAQYVAAPVVDRRTKVGKAEYASFLEAAGDREVINPDEWALAERMATAIQTNDMTRKLLDSCEDREHTVRWKHERSGLWVKCRRDFRRPGLVGDLKSTSALGPYPFVRQMLNFDSHLQAAMYTDSEIALTGEHDASFAFMAVHKAEPHEVMVCELGQVGDRDDAETAIQLGRREYETALDQIAECMDTGDWRNPWEKKPQVIDLPNWAGKESEWR